MSIAGIWLVPRAFASLRQRPHNQYQLLYHCNNCKMGYSKANRNVYKKGHICPTVGIEGQYDMGVIFLKPQRCVSDDRDAAWICCTAFRVDRPTGFLK